ncbi:hypothetical protein IQ279_17595 [Streptomyces verrucosisporus]|uniref:hypothetical protein n=1 Tax=Streptomyces verrucosisporus TaxID=1695161 RepID=UPI0019D10617|nr:hypothetical protein [Streptomyces verrucosisporus]MBN3931422.1 hypothetical protein [Streptomyces verrucosisporus]
MSDPASSGTHAHAHPASSSGTHAHAHAHPASSGTHAHAHPASSSGAALAHARASHGSSVTVLPAARGAASDGRVRHRTDRPRAP